jgi:hypothetical protein
LAINKGPPAEHVTRPVRAGKLYIILTITLLQNSTVAFNDNRLKIMNCRLLYSNFTGSEQLLTRNLA